MYLNCLISEVPHGKILFDEKQNAKRFFGISYMSVVYVFQMVGNADIAPV